jgi:tRNA(fMet)-specific endonuclease VapC
MLDTNLCIYLMKNQPAQVAERFAQCYLGEVVMSALTFAELSYGVSVSADPRRDAKNLSSLVEDIPVAPFDELAGSMYGPIRLATRESKKGHLDKLIAAHSKALSVTLVTNNLKDFEKYQGVTAENWLV